MSDSLHFVVPMPPNLANARMHHMVKHRAKVGYWETLDVIALLSRNAADGTEGLGSYDVPPAPPVPFARASIRSTMYLGAPMDDGNAMNRHKWIEDWLTTRRYLVDDRRACLTWESLPEQVVRRDGNYCIALTVTPLDNSH